MKHIFAKILIGTALVATGHSNLPCLASSCCQKPNSTKPADGAESPAESLDQILNKMAHSVASLNSLQADVQYLFIQDPELLDARTLRKGILYYSKKDQKSLLRISFNTVQQDDEDPQLRPEHYLFDGVWLTKIDTEMETIDLYQKAPADQPVGVFEFISHNFPMVGFTDPKKLEKEFEISLEASEKDPNQPYHLSLNVREDSMYKEDYTEIEVWVSPRTWLPERLIAISVQGDIYELEWHNPQINKTIAPDFFTVETPAHFRKNVHSLEK